MMAGPPGGQAERPSSIGLPSLDHRERSQAFNRETVMRKYAFSIIIVLGGFAVTHQANAVVCANGVY